MQSEFDVAPGTTQSGGSANITSALPEGSGYYVHSFTGAPDFKLGVSLTTLPGLAADYGDTGEVADGGDFGGGDFGGGDFGDFGGGDLGF